MSFKVRIGPQSLLYQFQNEIMDHPRSDGDPKAIGSDDENIMKDVPNFVNDTLRVPNCITRWGSALNHSLMGSKMKSYTIHVQMGDPEAIGSNVPNLMKDVPNFVKDAPKVPKCILRWGSALNHFLRGSKMKSYTIHV